MTVVSIMPHLLLAFGAFKSQGNASLANSQRVWQIRHFEPSQLNPKVQY